MKKFLFVVLTLWTVTLARAESSAWFTDLPTAMTKAKAENKLVLLDFTGSDWCGWCIKLGDEVFSKAEFIQYAAKNLILVTVDFPHKTPQSEALKNANEALARKYGITGFPTVIILNQNGQKVAQLGYMPGGPRAFIAQIPSVAASANIAQAPAAPEPPPTTVVHAPAPAMVPAAPVLPTEVTLKAITGSKKSALVIINNKTLGVGEETRIKLADREVKVRCESIEEKSAVVTVDGERKELKLRSGS